RRGSALGAMRTPNGPDRGRLPRALYRRLRDERDAREQRRKRYAERSRRDLAALVQRALRLHHVVRRRPVGPGDEVGKALAVELRMPFATPPRRPVQQLVELRTRRVGEEGEVDLVRVLVLHDAPGETAGVEEIRVEPDLVGRRVRGDAWPHVHDDGARIDVPWDRTRVRRAGDLCLLGRRAAVEDVVAA